VPDPFLLGEVLFEILSEWFSHGFEPNGQCFLCQRPLLWLYVASVSWVTISYYVISIALVNFVTKRHDLASRCFLMFSAFILACGTSDLMGIWTPWEPVYWLQGSVKPMTAGLSVATAATLWPS
jgi:hypothetical protein